jgi:hypothetical protein
VTPAAIGPLLAMQHATNADDAHALAMAAVLAGATGAEAQQAISEWTQLQHAQVQQLFANQPKRPACCTGTDRSHK